MRRERDPSWLNITPYDEDNTAATGTTTLRHIDQSTRLAWSTTRRRPGGSVPLGPRVPAGLHAAGRPADDADDAECLAPEPRRRRLAADDLPVGPGRRADLGPRAGSGGRQHLAVDADARRPARRRSTSRRPAPAPPASSSGPATTGRSRCTLDSCAAADRPGRRTTGSAPARSTDGGIPPWSPDMSGRVIRSMVVPIAGGRRRTSRSRSTPPPTRARGERLGARLVRDAGRRGAGVRARARPGDGEPDPEQLDLVPGRSYVFLARFLCGRVELGLGVVRSAREVVLVMMLAVEVVVAVARAWDPVEYPAQPEPGAEA